MCAWPGSPARRRLSGDTTTTTSATIDGASVLGLSKELNKEEFATLTLYFVVTVEFDPDDGHYLKVIANLLCWMLSKCVWKLVQGVDEG